jgi:SAM-dependent methyltransferase
MDRLELTARAQRGHFWFRGFRRFLDDRLRRTLSDRRDLRILDCGCGTGANLELLGRYGRVWAFDLSAVGLAHAREAGRPLVRADVTRVPFRDGAFDVATSFDVFQMLPDDRPALVEMARVVRPGGTVVVSAAALEALRGDHSAVWEEARRYTPAMMRTLVAGAGLELLDVRFLFASLVPLMYAVRSAQRRFPRRDGPRPDSDIRVPPAPLNALLGMALAAEAMIGGRLPMPFGSSLLVTARKPAA